MRHPWYSLAFVLLGSVATARGVEAQTCSRQDECCGNRICDAGEDRGNCPEDCDRGCNQDYRCEPGKGETAANCPSDCPGACVPNECGTVCGHPPDGCGGQLDCPCCFPTGCSGRCGRVDDGCGGTLDCGACAPVCPHPDGVCEPDKGEDPDVCPAECNEKCGNGHCDVGEHTRCPSDCPAPPPCANACAAGCPLFPVMQISNVFPVVREKVTFYAVPDSIEGEFVNWDFGDGSHCDGCARTVSHDYKEARQYAVRLTATENRCHSTSLSQPNYVTVSGPGLCPHEDGICQPELGEDEILCPKECDERCGQDGCQLGEHYRCPSDCPPAPCDTWVCEAGCAKHPTFTLSNPYPVVGELVSFTAFPNFIEGTKVNWDFGDGSHCDDDCTLSTTHAYATPGQKEIRITAQENVCHSPQLSYPLTVVVKALGSVAGDGAIVLSQDLPTALPCGTTYPASVTVQNVGSTPWIAGIYKLGAVGDKDPFAATTRVALDRDVPPLGTYTFHFALQGKGPSGWAVTDWQMVHEDVAWFGGKAEAVVSVPTSCGPADPGDAYNCDVLVTDGYGRAMANVEVQLTSYLREEGQEPTALFTAWGRSLPDGRAWLSVPSTAPADYLECRAWPPGPARQARMLRRALHGESGVPRGTVVELRPILAPAPNDRFTVPGLKEGGGHGRGEARLYLSGSGSYDRVVIIPQGMDFGEQNSELRLTPDQMWFQFEPFLVELYKQGYSVWLFRPYKTGENIHEQAAEFAQAIDRAARYRGGPPGGKVIVSAYSLGGVVARLTTARWQGDPGWRALAGLPDELPVKLVAFGDAPLRGANANLEMQHFLWEHDRQGDFNLNSCAAQQLLRRSCQTGGAHPTCSDRNHRAFFATGDVVMFDQAGVCDRTSGGQCICDAGPAVFTVNDTGFPAVRKAAFSAGTWEPDFNKCYGDGRDRNHSEQDVCAHDPGGSGAFRPQVNDVFLTVAPRSCPFGWQSFHADAADLEAGSRFSVGFDGGSGSASVDLEAITLENLFFYSFGKFLNSLGVCTGDYDFVQNFAFTFIPIRSALAADEPGSVPFAPDDTRTSTFQGIHDSPPRELIGWLIRKFNQVVTADALPTPAIASVTAASAAAPGQPVVFQAAEGEGVAVGYVWDFGDGGVTTGHEVSHAFRLPGTYSVRLTVTGEDAATSSTEWPVVIGDLGNAAHNRVPSLEVASTGSCGGTGCTVTFDVAGRDIDGDPLAYRWLGCASGQQSSATCQRSGSGPLVAVATVSDGKGGFTTRQTQVDVLATAYATGSWGTCESAAAWACESAGPGGCTRPGTVMRTVVETAWSLDPAAAVPAPDATQDCRQTADGYVASYASVYEPVWTCTSTGAGGCRKNRLSYAPATYRAAAPDEPPPAAVIYATGYVAGYGVGPWSVCSRSCGGGTRTRTVTPAAWTEMAPGAAAPATSQACNTQACPKTCYDYPDTYPSLKECQSNGWPVCERRFRDDGYGNTLTCWKGFH